MINYAAITVPMFLFSVYQGRETIFDDNYFLNKQEV